VKESAGTTFRKRVALAASLLVCVTLSVTGIAFWGVIRIHQDSALALRGYRQLREVFEVGVYVEQARQSLREATPNTLAARRGAELAQERLDLFTTTDGGWLDDSKPVESQLRDDLSQAANAADGPAIAESLDGALSNLAMLASQVRVAVETYQTAEGREQRVTLILIGVFSGVFVLLAILIARWHYRSVMNPIDRLAETVRSFASGQLDQRFATSGDREFVQLAGDLNRMADELQTLYHQLEEKVAEKSRELVRSERLASVGYLAAGVAHEINNPLGIIAAYAERALQRLRRGSLDSGSAENIQQTLSIICEEAFRCKEITDRLLTMARGGNENRKAVSIAALAQEVVAMIAGLPQFKHAHLTLECDEDHEKLAAVVNDAEIKQVLLNLLVNAVEAIDERGKVSVAVRDARDWVEIVVQDDGKGMESETLHRVFEPFFSDKKSQRPGTGLGLSICHAIVESHGGKLIAASEGVGKGSRFVMTLPATKEVEIAHV
jgi:two-component system, NtrC family, sensor kinase